MDRHHGFLHLGLRNTFCATFSGWPLRWQFYRGAQSPVSKRPHQCKLNLTTASDQHITVGRDVKERVGNISERIAKLKHVVQVKDGGTIWLGNEQHNVLQLLSELMGIVKQLAEDLSTHTHLGVTTGSGKTKAPEQADQFSGASSDTGQLKSKLDTTIE